VLYSIDVANQMHYLVRVQPSRFNPSSAEYVSTIMVLILSATPPPLSLAESPHSGLKSVDLESHTSSHRLRIRITHQCGVSL